jgi:ribosomal protein L37AE/L43A
MLNPTRLHNEICRRFKNEDYSQFFLSEYFEIGCRKIKTVVLEDVVSNNGILIGYCDVVIEFEDDEKSKQKALIEIKSSADAINKDSNDVLRQIKKYRFYNKSITKTFLVYPGDASNQPIEDTAIFTDEKITVLNINEFEEKERQYREERERLEQAEKKRLEQEEIERVEKERLVQEEIKRLEQAEKERLKQEEVKRLEQAEKEREAKEERKRAEEERLAKEEEREREKIERIAYYEELKENPERLLQEIPDRKDRENLEKELIAQLEKERIELSKKEKSAGFKKIWSEKIYPNINKTYNTELDVKKNTSEITPENATISDYNKNCPKCSNHKMIRYADNKYWICTRCGRKKEILPQEEKERKERAEKERIEQRNMERLCEDMVQQKRKNAFVSANNIICPKCQKPMIKDAFNPYWICTKCGRKIKKEKQSLCENEMIHLAQKAKDPAEIEKRRKRESERHENEKRRLYLKQ